MQQFIFYSFHLAQFVFCGTGASRGIVMQGEQASAVGVAAARAGVVEPTVLEHSGHAFTTTQRTHDVAVQVDTPNVVSARQRKKITVPDVLIGTGMAAIGTAGIVGGALLIAHH